METTFKRYDKRKPCTGEAGKTSLPGVRVFGKHARLDGCVGHMIGYFDAKELLAFAQRIVAEREHCTDGQVVGLGLPALKVTYFPNDTASKGG